MLEGLVLNINRPKLQASRRLHLLVPGNDLGHVGVSRLRPDEEMMDVFLAQPPVEWVVSLPHFAVGEHECPLHRVGDQAPQSCIQRDDVHLGPGVLLELVAPLSRGHLQPSMREDSIVHVFHVQLQVDTWLQRVEAVQDSEAMQHFLHNCCADMSKDDIEVVQVQQAAEQAHDHSGLDAIFLGEAAHEGQNATWGEVVLRGRKLQLQYLHAALGAVQSPPRGDVQHAQQLSELIIRDHLRVQCRPAGRHVVELQHPEPGKGLHVVSIDLHLLPHEPLIAKVAPVSFLRGVSPLGSPAALLLHAIQRHQLHHHGSLNLVGQIQSPMASGVN